MRILYSTYPWQAVFMLLALLFAGLAEGVSLSALLPLLNLAIKTHQSAPAIDTEARQGLGDLVNSALHDIGVTPTIGTLLAVIVLGATLKSLLLLLANRKVGYVAAQVATDLRLALLRAIFRTRWEYFLNQPVGRITNSLATEAKRAAEAFVNGVTVLHFLIQATIYGAVALSVSWKATLLSLFVAMIILGLSHFLVHMARRAGKKQTRLLASLLARTTDTLQSIKPLKSMAREHLADSILAIETRRLNKALQKQVFSAAVLNAAQEEMFTVVIALGMFVALVGYGMPFSTVMVLVVVLGRMLSQFGKVQKQYQKMVVGESAYWSISNTIQEAAQATEELPSGRTPTLTDWIRFENVNFSYSDKRIFQKMSLEIPARSLTALIGPSGVGKTTMLDLIVGLVQPEGGSIRIDGMPMHELDLRSWRRMLGYVPQENLLLHESVEANVSLGDPQITRSDVEAALMDAGAWEFVSSLPEGMDTTVGERGGKLSGGQRQRIMIARALVHRPALLILDEATSALDPASEKAICRTLERLRARITILAVSHQETLVESAERVYRLEQEGVVLVK